MRIANASIDGVGRLIASESGGEWIDFTQALAHWELANEGIARSSATTLQHLLEHPAFALELPERVLDFTHSRGLASRISVCDLVFRAPFVRPGQIIALARNYSAHAKESTLPIPHEPVFFSKSNTSVIGPGEPIVLPPNLGRIEPEIELDFIIGRRACHIPAGSAAGYIAGFTILNDVSAQELQAREIRESYPLFRCKSLPTFTPMGPWIVTTGEIGLSPALDMTLRVNGETRVATNTAGLTFGIARLLEFVSGYIDLQPGDVITTGCPKAAGAIHSGDYLELEIEGIGTLHNPVTAGTEQCPA